MIADIQEAKKILEELKENVQKLLIQQEILGDNQKSLHDRLVKIEEMLSGFEEGSETIN